jgi:hypothetical protein
MNERTTVMTDPLTQAKTEAVLMIFLMAVVADGGKSDVERAR